MKMANCKSPIGTGLLIFGFLASLSHAATAAIAATKNVVSYGAPGDVL